MSTNAGQVIHALSEGDITQVAVLLHNFEDINDQYEMLCGGTLLHHISYMEDVRVPLSLLLLEKGLDPNISDMGNVSPLHVAASTNDAELTQMLLDYQANINSQDSNGWTPLHHAAHSGATESMDVLLRSGANTKICNEEGNMAMDIALEEVVHSIKPF